MNPEERSRTLRNFVGSLTTGQNTPSEKPYDPIEDAMNRNPKLTREEALKIAKEFGF
jgi:hypothetical protein